MQSSTIILNKELLNYLMPKNNDLDENNLPLGIILAFTKTITISPELFDNLDDYQINQQQKFSVLIFYSFLTGRVERYLMNYSKFLLEDSKFRSKNTNFIDENKFIYKNKEYWIDHSIEHRSFLDENLNYKYTPWQIQDFQIFNDGIITKHFYNAFIIELIRECLFDLPANGYLKTYKDPNFDYIRKLTRPYYQELNETTFGPVSSGDRDYKETLIIDADTKYKLRNITPNKTKIDIENYPEDITPDYLIYIPKTYEKNPSSQLLKSIGNIKTLLKRDYPQGLLDFKKSLSFSTIDNINDLSIRIRKYNYYMNKILTKHQPYKNHNPNL